MRNEMSKERELLKKCFSIIKEEFEYEDIHNDLIREIKEELAKPELVPVPLNDDQIDDEFELISKDYDPLDYDYRIGFIDGVKFSEKHHGIVE